MAGLKLRLKIKKGFRKYEFISSESKRHKKKHT